MEPPCLLCITRMSRMHAACPGGRDSWRRAGDDGFSIVANLPIVRCLVGGSCLLLNFTHVLQAPIHDVPQILCGECDGFTIDAELVDALLYVFDANIGLMWRAHRC